MKKKQSNWWRMTWIAVTLPLIGVSLMAFSKPKEALQEAVDNSVKVIEQPLAEMMEAENVEVPEVVEAPAMPAEQPQKKNDDVKAGTVVKGTVCGQDGKKLQYATVVETDEIGRIVASAQTDNNGSFSLKVVNPQHKLRVSYVGFKSASLAIADQMNVTLEPATMMTDVVVRGVKDSIDKSNPRYNDTALDSGDDTVFNVVEQMPSFPGGNGELMKYLSRKLMFPPVAREMSVEADITVKFTVDKTGFVRAPQVVSVSSRSPLVTDEVAKAAKDGDEAAIETSRNYADAVEALKEEAIHVVRTMPRWEPGRQNGKRIDTSYTLPINFKLN